RIGVLAQDGEGRRAGGDRPRRGRGAVAPIDGGGEVRRGGRGVVVLEGRHRAVEGSALGGREVDRERGDRRGAGAGRRQQSEDAAQRQHDGQQARLRWQPTLTHDSSREPWAAGCASPPVHTVFAASSEPPGPRSSVGACRGEIYHVRSSGMVFSRVLDRVLAMAIGCLALAPPAPIVASAPGGGSAAAAAPAAAAPAVAGPAAAAAASTAAPPASTAAPAASS